MIWSTLKTAYIVTLFKEGSLGRWTGIAFRLSDNELYLDPPVQAIPFPVGYDLQGVKAAVMHQCLVESIDEGYCSNLSICMQRIDEPNDTSTHCRCCHSLQEKLSKDLIWN